MATARLAPQSSDAAFDSGERGNINNHLIGNLWGVEDLSVLPKDGIQRPLR